MKPFKLLLPMATLALLAGCAPGFEARVARFSQLPPPAGQSFVIEARNPDIANGLEFATYANLVRQRLLANGYVEAATPAQSNLTVKLDYTVGPPREKLETRPGPNWGWGPYWGPGYGRFGGGFGWGGYGGWGFGPWGAYGPWSNQEVYSITQYNAALALKIERTADKASVFEGRAETVSTSNNLTKLVPNLVTAIFTNFPGGNGETVRVSFDPANPGKPAVVRPGR